MIDKPQSVVNKTPCEMMPRWNWDSLLMVVILCSDIFRSWSILDICKVVANWSSTVLHVYTLYYPPNTYYVTETFRDLLGALLVACFRSCLTQSVSSRLVREREHGRDYPSLTDGKRIGLMTSYCKPEGGGGGGKMLPYVPHL